MTELTGAGRAVDTARFHFVQPLDGLWVATARPMQDARGHFARSFCRDEFAAVGRGIEVAQVNRSLSRQAGTVRGMHFQHPPHQETKIVSCTAGRIFDVAVDLRRGSGTFLQWFGIELSGENLRSLIVPPGFAHGFQTLTDDAEVMYLVSTPYSATAEDGLNPFDPAVGVAWPLHASAVSERDANRPHLSRDAFAGIDITGLA